MSRYSQLYIELPTPMPDGPRARRRLGKLLEKTIGPNSEGMSALLEEELGIRVGIEYSFEWPKFFQNCDIRDFLDSVTLICKYFRTSGYSRGIPVFLSEARRIFAEERLAYAIDDMGVVHPAVDREFQRNRQATIEGLGAPRYSNSLAAFERVSDELNATPPNGKDAWRAVFTAIEGLFRLMFPRAPQLNAGEIDANLAVLLQKTYTADPVALRAATKQLAAFKDWIDSSHFYRHEQGSEEPVQPPLDLAVLAISSGAAFLRWLIALDQIRETTLPVEQ